MRLNPYICSNLDIVETALTLILMLLSSCGMVFSATQGNPVFEAHQDFLTWISYLGMVLGSFLCAALLANELFELAYTRHLHSADFLGDRSADPVTGRAELVYSKNARAVVAFEAIEDLSRLSSPSKRHTSKNPLRRMSTMLLVSLRSRVGKFEIEDDPFEERVDSGDTKLFQCISLLRLHRSMQHLDPGPKASCVLVGFEFARCFASPFASAEVFNPAVVQVAGIPAKTATCASAVRQGRIG